MWIWGGSLEEAIGNKWFSAHQPLENAKKSGMLVRICISRTGVLRQEDQHFEACLGNIVRL